MDVEGQFSIEKLLFQTILEHSFDAIIIADSQNRLVEVNFSACNLLGFTRDELIGQSMFDFVIGSFEGQEEANSEEVQVKSPNGQIKTLECKLVKNLLPNYKLLMFRDVTKLKLASEELHHQHQRVKLFSEVTLKINQSLQLKEILQTAVTEVQRILKADRVLIYQLLSNGTGITISEAVLPNVAPILAIEFPEEVFPEEYRKLYAEGRIQAISDLHGSEAGVAECLVEFMDEWMVKAKLVVPIIQSVTNEAKAPNQLWGLLIAHQCQTTRQWKDFELEMMQQLASQIGIALSQAELRENLEGLVAERTTKLRQANTNLQQEINDRRSAEAALRRSEEKLRLIANGLPVLIAYVDKHQCYRFNNKAYQTWLGLSPTKIYGSHLQEVHGKKEYHKIQEYVEMALSGKMITYENETTFQDEHLHTVNVSYIPHIDKQEKDTVKGFFSLISDISDRKAIERMKDEFISVVSHELRTPLTSIHSSLKILATGKLGNLCNKGQRMLRIADEQTDRLVRLVNNVLDLQSIQSGKVKMNKKACQAMELMIEACQTMQAMAQEYEVNLFSKSVAFLVWADRDYIVQTLTNLLSNAIKFSPPNSTVFLSAKMEPPQQSSGREKQISYVTFEVKDQGQGIPADKLETIFERFQQVDSSDSRKKGGTGLGLTICRQIIEEHGGKIWAESCLGKGSTFYFTLPLVIEESGGCYE
ncbi:ATP-binding protein [Dapis sp. BLCC M126]|uniref:ATP-binding protein n=1 Tax=Dapis sp. BLCC M126 TaxID=3400189 RepID=UPI003CF202E7